MYSVATVLALIVALLFWRKRALAEPQLGLIYLAALVGGFIGAELGYLLAEGFWRWQKDGLLLSLFGGKTILGALIGGYISVEVAKRVIVYLKPTGDLFATLIPFSIALGRIGCISAGCCIGKVCEIAWLSVQDINQVARWPAPLIEIIFNLLIGLSFVVMRRYSIKRGQHFNIYLISYGIFRFFHEFLRESPRLFAEISGYHILALGLILIGHNAYRERAKFIGSNESCSKNYRASNLW